MRQLSRQLPLVFVAGHKSIKGKLDVGDPRAWWPDTLDRLAAIPLPLRPDYISAVYQLAPIDLDPFDRMLIAQATVEA